MTNSNHPYETGLDAIINSSETLAVQIKSFIYFVIIFGGLFGVLFGISLDVAIAFTYPGVASTAIFFYSTAAGMLYSSVAGLTRGQAATNGVPELFGSYVNWWLSPAGISWWFPYPFGAVKRRVAVGEITSSITQTDIEAADNVQVTASYTLKLRVKKPLIYARFADGPEEVFGGLMIRTMRWFVSLYKSTKLPAVRKVASEVMAGTCEELVPSDGIEGTKTVDFKSTNGRTIADSVEEMGFEILEALVSDFSLPPVITAAAEKGRVESIQRKYERAEMTTILQLMVKMQKKFPDLSDDAILNAVQAERQKITKIVVDGSASEMAKAASLLVNRNDDAGD